MITTEGGALSNWLDRSVYGRQGLAVLCAMAVLVCSLGLVALQATAYPEYLFYFTTEDGWDTVVTVSNAVGAEISGISSFDLPGDRFRYSVQVFLEGFPESLWNDVTPTFTLGCLESAQHSLSALIDEYGLTLPGWFGEGEPPPVYLRGICLLDIGWPAPYPHDLNRLIVTVQYWYEGKPVAVTRIEPIVSSW